MLETWLLTVFGLSTSSPAISALLFPRAIIPKISRSRSVRSGKTLGGKMGCITDRSQHVFLIGSLEEIAPRSCPHGREDRGVIFEHGEYQNADVWMGLHDAARRLNTIESWHVQIHQDDIRLQFRGLCDRFLAA